MPVNINLIDQIPLFGGLSFKDKQQIAAKIVIKTFKQNEMLFNAGDDCRMVRIVFSGKIKIFRTSPQGKEQIFEVLEAGDTCACNPGSGVWNCTASAQALTDGTMGMLNRAEYGTMVRNNSAFSRSLNQIFADRLCRFSALIEEVALDSPEQRVIKFLSNMASSQVKNGRPPNEPVKISFTHEEIAQRLGLVRETVTRNLQKLKQKGYIEIKPQQIIILNLKALQDHRS